jgi:hypothetical protein
MCRAISSLSVTVISTRQNLDRVLDLGGKPMAGDALTQLQDAARVTRDNELGLYSSDMGDLTVQKLLRSVGMSQVIDPGTPTAPVALRHFKQLQIGNL